MCLGCRSYCCYYVRFQWYLWWGGHQHGGHSGAETNAHANHGVVDGDNQSSDPVRMDSYKIKQLEGEIDLLKNQNEILQEKVEEYLKNKPSTKHV